MRYALYALAIIVLLPIVLEILLLLLLVILGLWVLLATLAGSVVFAAVYANLYLFGLHNIPVETWYGDYSLAFCISAIVGGVATVSSLISMIAEASKRIS